MMKNEKLRQLFEAKDKDKNGPKNGKNGSKKYLNKLHSLDDEIETFVDGLEDEIMKTEDNPVFVKKAQQLLADMSKEYSEFIMALRAIVNAVDRKGKILPSFEKQESKVRDIRDGAGAEAEAPPEEEEPPPEEEEESDEFVIAKKGKDKKKKGGVKEALESI